uniref:NB-ARC domain-containing protein n=1 Tax=Oryza nivara TaxID=4536 RepID=A0A0E0IZJ6_ORYNI
MAEVGAMLTSAVLKMVGEKIGSAIGGRIKLQWDFNYDLKDMKMTLETIEVFLKDAERRSIREESVRLWLRRLKNVMYNISDMIDGFEAETTRKIKTAKEMKRMRGELEKITKQHKDFSFASENSSNIQEVVSSDRKTSSKVFDLDKIESSIISQLSKREPNMTDLEMVPPNMNIIMVLDDLWENDGFKLDSLKLKLKVGNGAKVIILVTTRDKTIAMRFSNVEPYKLEPLTDDMCWKIIKQKSAFEGRGDRECLEHIGKEIARKCGGVALAAQSLGYILHSKRADEWESVRDSNIWNESTSEDTSSPHHMLASLKLSYLTMKPCLKICFGYCAMFPKGQRIVKDDLICQWICLDLIETSKVYSSKQLGEIYVNQLLGMSFLQHPESIARVHQENVTLFTIHDLVHDLASSVMVDEILVSSKQDNNGESNYRYALLSDSTKPLHSFTKFPAKMRALRFVDCSKTGLHYDAFSGAKYYLRVLDLSDCFLQKLPDSIGQLRQLRYLSAPGLQDTMIPDCITKLSELIYFNLHGSSALCSLPESVGEMDSLMHLDLSGCSGIQRVPQSFGKLKLSYLDLSNCSSLKGLSEFLGNLTKLQHLNLSYCESVEKLGNLGSLTELQYFHFSTSSCSPGLSQTDICAFTKLEYLNLSTEFTDIKIKKLPDAMGSFMKLEYLDLSGWRELEELPKSWGSLKNLIHLDLSKCFKIKGVPEALSSLTKLQYLNLSDCCCDESDRLQLRGLEEVVGKLTELRYLYLSKFLDILLAAFQGEAIAKKVDVFYNMFASISSLSHLQELDLSNNDSITFLPESIGNLNILHTLNLSSCLGLVQLPRVMHDMDNLKHLNVSGCCFLDKSIIPKLSGILFSLPQFAVQTCNGESSSNLVMLQKLDSTTTPELEISKLENVITVEEAQRVRLKEKKMISDLTLCWTRDVRRFVEDRDLLGELEPPRDLQKFKLQGYNSVAFPDWLMNIAPHHFPGLSRIDLVDLPKCTCLPPLGQLPRLTLLSLEGMNGITKIDGEFCGRAGAFSSLSRFSISNMKRLVDWQMKYSSGEVGDVGEFMFPMLKRLIIHHCPKLSLKCWPPNKVTYLDIESSDNVISSWPLGACASVKRMVVKSCKLPLHQWRMLCQLAPQSTLVIESCSDVGSSSPEIAQALSSLKELTLTKGNDDMLELPNWMGELTCLESLEIIGRRCLELKASRGVMRHLIWLTSLTLRECDSIVSLPEWLGDLSSVRNLKIVKCLSLNNLQGIMDGHLSSLEKLEVVSCKSISALPKRLGEVTSLKKLYIHRCSAIKSLPYSIHKLTNLKTLQVTACPELKKWCESKKNKTKFSHVLNYPVYYCLD